MRITIHDDFDLDKIIGCGQCFRPRRLADGTYLFPSAGRALRLRSLGAGEYEADCRTDEWDAVWARYFDLSRDYAALRAAIPPDEPFLREAAACGAGLRVLRQDPWETLVSFILSQRKSIPAIRGCVEQLCRAFGEPLAGGLFAFPAPERLAQAAPEALRACSLGYRADYVRDAAERVSLGALDLAALETADDETLMAALLSVRGVGVKVANCTALFAYGRASCAPVDVWIRRIIDRRCGGENPFCRFGGCAGILQQYCFYYALQEKQALRD
jgi:N-glycosylase/DNA lyase